MSADRQLGLLWGLAAASLLALAPFAPLARPLLPACPAKSLLGLPCPGCGSGAAALALARFDLPAAMTASPLAALAWTVFIAGGLASVLPAVTGRALPRPAWRPRLPARLLAAAALLANWAYLLWRGA